MKAVIYARYSSDKQTEQSIEGQMRVCKSFAEANGFEIVGEYVDRAISGKSASKRPNFLQMISDAERGKFESIIVYKLDRFSRNRYDSIVFKQKLKECGVKVKSATEQISDGAEGMLVEGLLETMAELYSHDLSQKVKRGMRENFLKGKFGGGNALFGYKIVDKRVELDERNSQAVKHIFAEYIKGASIKSLVDWLNENNYKTTRGAKFSHSSFNRFFSNEKYIGVYRYGDEVNYNAYPRIIDDETFAKAQEIKKLKMHVKEKREGVRDYYLVNKIFCGKCGNKVTATSSFNRQGTRHCYYICNGKKRKKICDNKAIRKGYLECMLFNNMTSTIVNEKELERMVDKVIDNKKQGVNRLRINTLKDKIKQLDKEIAKLFDLFKNAGTNKTFINKLNEESEELGVLKIDYEKEIEKLELLESKFDYSKKDLMKKFKAIYDSILLNSEDKYKFIKDYINSIYIFDNKMIVYYSYSPKSRVVTFEEVKTHINDARIKNAEIDFNNKQNESCKRHADDDNVVAENILKATFKDKNSKNAKKLNMASKKQVCCKPSKYELVAKVKTKTSASPCKATAHHKRRNQLSKLIFLCAI